MNYCDFFLFLGLLMLCHFRSFYCFVLFSARSGCLVVFIESWTWCIE